MNRSNSIVFVIVGTVGLLVGYDLGGLRDTSTTDPTQVQPQRTITALPHSEAALPQEFELIARGGSGSAHVLLTATLRDMHDPERIRYLLERTSQLPADISQAVARGILLNNWVRIDPIAAADWAATNAERHLNPLLHTWATEDLQGAHDTIASGPPSTYTAKLTAAVLVETAKTNPDQALDTLIRLNSKVSDRTRHQLDDALKLIVRLDSDAALDSELRVPAWLRQKLRGHAAALMVETNPSAALDWWREQPDARKLTSSTFSKLPSSEWNRALDLLHELRDEQSTLHSFVRNSHYSWARNDPSGFLSLFATAMNDDRWSESLRKSFQTGLRSAISQHSEEATAWIDGLTDPETKRIAQEALDEHTRRVDRKPMTTAAAFIANPSAISYGDYGKLTPSERGLLADQLINTPEAIPTVLHRITQHGQSVPMAELERLLTAAPTEGKTAEAIARTVSTHHGIGFINYSPSEAARWAESLPAGPTLDAVAARVMVSWNNYDPDAARAWAESLEDPSARAAALLPIDSPSAFGELQRQRSIEAIKARR